MFINKNGNKQKIKVALLTGGSINPERRKDTLHGVKPRIDVLEMEARFNAKLIDYDWFEQRTKVEWLTRGLFNLARRYGHWSELLSLRSLWSIRHYDVLYTTGEDVGYITAILLRLFRFKKPRLILRMEQPVFGKTPFRRFIFTFILRSAVRRVDLILTRTEAHAAYLRNQLNISSKNVFFSPETTDTAFFNCSIPPVNVPIKSSLSRPFIVSAGLEMRDYETLISAVRGLPVTVVIAAGSPWAKVRFHYSASELPENVLVSSFTPVEMRELYRSAAFVVLPIKPTSRACGMNVVLEAWAMGRAVIASRTDGLVSYIQDQKTGYFVTPGNVGELQKAILHLLDNQEEVERLGRNGYLRVTSELCIERYLETVEATLTRIASDV